MNITLYRAPWLAVMLAGPFLLVDNLAPSVHERVTVMGLSHTRIETQRHHHNNRHYTGDQWTGSDGSTFHKHASAQRSNDWKLELDGTTIRECHVDASTWSRLSEGDEIEVRATRFTHRCTSIVHNGVKLWSNWLNGALVLLGGLFSLGLVFRPGS